VARYWVGVASREHVRRGVEGGFCQLSHGKAAPLRRLRAGDRIVYYSPRERLRDGEPVQAFTAIGEIGEGQPEAVEVNGFTAYRKRVRWFEAADAPIAPLLPQLELTRGRANWGVFFRRGSFEIARADYARIAKAMGAAEP
jgi:hypothetical protein